MNNDQKYLCSGVVFGISLAHGNALGGTFSFFSYTCVRLKYRAPNDSSLSNLLAPPYRGTGNPYVYVGA